MRIFKSRKGDLSLNTIVVAAIVMIVLVVLIMVYTGRMNIFTTLLNVQTEKSCSSFGGRVCVAGCPSEYEITDSKLADDQKPCCKITYTGEC